MLSLDWAAVRNGTPPRFSHQVQVACSDQFFECQAHYPPLTFIISYAKSMGHSVWTLKTYESGSEFMYGCTDAHDEQRSGRPSVSAKTIAKVEQEMLEDQHVTVRELWKWIPEPAQCGGIVIWQGYTKNAKAQAKVHRSQPWLHKKIAESPAFHQCNIQCQKRVSYVKKIGDLILQTRFVL